MPAINIKQMKITEPSRNFDATVNAETNIPAEDSTGLSGGFKFFTGIKAFFKGISALGTLTTTSRIPVTDSNGNVTYTTPKEIEKVNQIILGSAYSGSIEDIISNWATNNIIHVGNNVVKGGADYGKRITITNCGGVTNEDATLNNVFEISYTDATHYFVRVTIGRSYGTTIKSGETYEYYKESSTLSYWKKLVTETEINNNFLKSKSYENKNLTSSGAYIYRNIRNAVNSNNFFFYVEEIGTPNYLLAQVFFSDNSSVPYRTIISNRNLTLGATNNQGTQVIEGITGTGEAGTLRFFGYTI